MNCKPARIHYKLQFITKFTTIPKDWESGELLPVWVDNIDLGLLMVWFSWRHLYLQWICRNLIVPERPPSQKIWIWMSKASSFFPCIIWVGCVCCCWPSCKQMAACAVRCTMGLGAGHVDSHQGAHPEQPVFGCFGTIPSGPHFIVPILNQLKLLRNL